MARVFQLVANSGGGANIIIIYPYLDLTFRFMTARAVNEVLLLLGAVIIS